MTIAATVSVNTTNILRGAMRPPRQDGRRINHVHCVYCTHVVGESMYYVDDIGDTIEDWEPYVEKSEGPVCWMCAKHYDQIRAAWERDNANAALLAMGRRYRRGNPDLMRPTPEEVLALQTEQAEKIQVALNEGKSQTHIARNLGVSATTVQRRIKRFGLAPCGA